MSLDEIADEGMPILVIYHRSKRLERLRAKRFDVVVEESLVDRQPSWFHI